ncbi:hypothetical protein LZF95_25005 [Algoriphagus sp. AGSA1]|uniref:Nmad2 family putative nucleotide modification protein n=1 Tax=Algoriphagus sp. AGSA1 TaxID=2907213 RepID=UPI001F1A50EB|nr:hypothetical protein [Algoriphagus sp. AGSA1]MCE7057968.1 hypothetical protein [Algoriphagus sp. AGSA1]
MPTLFSYCIPYDNGSAPNPFWGLCTLTICKPVIRRVAKVGDWIVATGSAKHGFSAKLVYAMEVTEKLTLAEYDEYCKAKLPEKLPDHQSEDYRRLAGDAIYDFSEPVPQIRKGVHDESNRQRDLGGQYALLSSHFYYFGDNPIDIPRHLSGIIKQSQGHKSQSNGHHFNEFVNWITSIGYAKNIIHSEPKDRSFFTSEKGYLRRCAQCDKEYDDIDEILTGLDQK